MRLFLTTITLLITFLPVIAQWNPDAGLIEPYSKRALITSSSGNNLSFINDGNIHTYWESLNPLPENYIKRKDLNIFLNPNLFTVSQVALQNAFDGILSSMATVTGKNVTITFNEPFKITLLSFKINTPDSVLIMVKTTKGEIKRTVASSENYSLIEIIPTTNSQIFSITLSSGNTFNIFEIAGLYNQPTETITIDLNNSFDIGWITTRHFNGEGVISIRILSSEDMIAWKHIMNLNPMNTTPVYNLIEPSIKARYIKVEFVLKQKKYQKAALHEIEIYNSFGPYGKPPKAKSSGNTWNESVGVNGFWGWGYNIHSDQLPENKGPNKFARIAHLARNYHNIDWDIQLPENDPEYYKMESGKGTNGKDWINWQREYLSWKQAGFNIDACILFNNQYFPDTLWKNTTTEAESYGISFAKYFINDNKLLNKVEIGNEPWEYSISTYRNILDGMSNGIRKTSSNATILPCATQAYYKYSDHNNYIDRFITLKNSKNLNGLVTHTYSYIFNNDGIRIAINPEDPRSEAWSVLNLQRFSAANLNDIPVYVTEFGYDSEGGHDDCTHSVCISEFEQAIYGTRMALLLYRLGVKEFYWYFYANTGHSTFHNLSGLTSSYNSGFIEKQSFFAFERLQKHIGDMYFNKAIIETYNVYAYCFANDEGKIKKVILWKPTSSNHLEKQWVEIPFSWDVLNAEYLVDNNNSENPSYVKGVKKLKILVCGNPIILTTE